MTPDEQFLKALHVSPEPIPCLVLHPPPEQPKTKRQRIELLEAKNAILDERLQEALFQRNWLACVCVGLTLVLIIVARIQ